MSAGSSVVHFAQIREDARVERALLAGLRRVRTVVAVASGGCTALSLLGPDVEVVHAVDVSPAQCALVELKRAALRALDRDALLAFLGERPSADRMATYRRLSLALSSEARGYWVAHPADIEIGPNRAGTTERFYRHVGARLRDVMGDAPFRALLDAGSLESQAALYREHFDDERFAAALRTLLSRKSHLEFFPAAMFAHAAEHDFSAFFADRFRQHVLTRPLGDNYFLSQIVWGRYLDDRPGGMPRWLSPEGWDEARSHVGRLEIHCAALEDLLPRMRDVDAFFLSNVFDWLDPAGRDRLAAGILAAAAPGAVVAWRNMLAAPPLPERLSRRLAVDEGDCERLAALDRSMLYRRVAAGVLS